VRVLVVADDLLSRTGLATLLAERSDQEIVGQLSGADLPTSAATFAPEVILWDMGWEAASGNNAVERLGDWEDAPCPVIVMVQDAAQAVESWSAGAKGLFLRSTRIDSVIAALVPVARGLIVIDPALADRMLAPREPIRPPAQPYDALTAREMEVLQYIAQGLPNKVIARRLNITESTVKFHVNAILGKLGAQSRTDAVVRATRLGLVML
jgi:two-component system, NarL family, nitrate/nitrite response regulator NarL